MSLAILRLGHRIFRDQRITSHCALVARSLRAQKFYYTGEKDQNLEDSIKKAVRNWGGPFEIEYIPSDRNFLKKHKGGIIHLTAYGIPFLKKIKEIKKQKNILVIVGGEKVPPDIYEQADYNLAVGSQPHSEVAALGIFLYELQGRKFNSTFKNPKLKIIPQKRGKKVVKT